MEKLIDLHGLHNFVGSGSVLIHADCFDVLPRVKSESIDLILCDLPYGTTKNKWDSVLPLDKLWYEYERIITKRGAIVLFAQTPFDKVLGASRLNLLLFAIIKTARA